MKKKSEFLTDIKTEKADRYVDIVKKEIKIGNLKQDMKDRYIVALCTGKDPLNEMTIAELAVNIEHLEKAFPNVQTITAGYLDITA